MSAWKQRGEVGGIVIGTGNAEISEDPRHKMTGSHLSQSQVLAPTQSY